MKASSSPGLAVFFLLLNFLCLAYISEGRDFFVGGKEGWVQKPSEPYNQWAGRNRFQVNDTLVFVYDKTQDSVLVVTKDDYSSCNTSSPIAKLDTGRDSFKFDRSGPFYFISGAPGHCQNGQKLIVIVLHIKGGVASPPSPPPSSPQPSPSSPQPSPSPPGSQPPPSTPPTKSGSSMKKAGVGILMALFVSAVFM